MIKIILSILICLSSISYSQTAGRGSSEKGGSRFNFKVRHHKHKQMRHFGRQHTDRLIQSNGTSYLRNKRLRTKNKVDGDGFSMPKQK